MKEKNYYELIDERPKQNIYGKHPYKEEYGTLKYIGTMEKTIHLYNTWDGYTISLETIIKNENRNKN